MRGSNRPTRTLRSTASITSSSRAAASTKASSSPSTVASPPAHTRILTREWQDLLDDDNKHIIIACDVGSTKFAACWAFQTKSTSPANVYIHDLNFGSDTLLPSRVGLCIVEGKDGKRVRLVHGTEARDLIEAGDVEPEHVFINLKQSKPFANAEAPESAKRKEYLLQLQDAHNKTLDEVKDHPAYISHRWPGYQRIDKLTTIEDVIRGLFKLLLMDIKVGMKSASNLDDDELDEMFSCGGVESLARKVRIGVAVPEMWSQERLEMYTLMTDAGFPPGLEILSEAKCAAAMVLKRKIEAMS